MLSIQDLCFQHCGPINLKLEPAECIILSGASGSGKTLFLRALADLDAHTGLIQFESKSLTDFEPTQWRETVSLLPAESGWWSEIVGEHFHEPENIDVATLGFGADVMSWDVTRLSSGERQRLSLLRLLENQPRVLLLDEPTANLDPSSTARVEQLLTDYRVNNNAALIWVSHDQQQAQRVAQRHLQISDGKLQSCP